MFLRVSLPTIEDAIPQWRDTQTHMLRVLTTCNPYRPSLPLFTTTTTISLSKYLVFLGESFPTIQNATSMADLLGMLTTCYPFRPSLPLFITTTTTTSLYRYSVFLRASFPTLEDAIPQWRDTQTHLLGLLTTCYP